MANTTPCRNAQQALVQRCGYGADACAALRFMEDLLQPDVGADRLAAGGNQHVDLVGRQLQARRDSVQPGALVGRKILEGDVLDDETDVTAVPAGQSASQPEHSFAGQAATPRNWPRHN